MKKKEAAHLVNQTFTQAFSEEQFVNFVRNLLPGMKPPSSQLVTGAQLKQGFQEHIHSYKRLGTYHDPLGDVLDVVVVKLKRHESLDRARTRQRNLMAHYLKDRQKDAVLVAYISEDPTDWRFSFVKLAYQTEITEKGIIKPKQVFTPARRYSFLVGEHEPNHTAQKQLGDLLMQDERLTLEHIEEAFNIESVTEEFFEDYKSLFLHIKENLDQIEVVNPKVKAEFRRCEVDTATFAKKLLGQIVFLYFLQKKGWLGVDKDEAWGTGDKNFLHNLFLDNKDKNFFDDILEPFFFEALAIERKGDYYQALQCNVPFLNGGLFEPLNGYDWENTHINLENKVFEEVFRVFNLYNFTVREDEPLEKEVAVDPEMLGKVFENLLEINDRKSKGAYYTPREIVHYMCQESLINYLDSSLKPESQKVTKEDIEVYVREGYISLENDSAKEAGRKSGEYGLPESIRKNAKEIDNALADIKICDPAIGSGAFPVGMMTEIVRARSVLKPYLSNQRDRDPYTFKWHCIENSLYGVDIDVSAVEIAKLRLWLSLVVEEESYDNIRPLPNLDYRIMCGNSLIGVDVKDKFFFWKKIQILEQKKVQYFGTTSHRSKDILREEIDLLIDELTNGKQTFDFEVYFSEVFSSKNGFDVVVGNPPYLSLEKVKENKDTYKRKYVTASSRADLYCLFYEQGLKILKPLSGILCYITSNKWMYANYGRRLREYFSNRNPIVLVNFVGSNIFQATVDVNILIIENKENQNQLFACRIDKINLNYDALHTIFENEKIRFQNIGPDAWYIRSNIENELVSKISKTSKPLREWDVKIKFGIKTGYNKAFIIDQAAYDDLIRKDKNNRDLLRPILQGRDIERFGYNWKNTYLVEVKFGDYKSLPTEFPKVYKYLDKHKIKLQARGQCVSARNQKRNSDFPGQHHWLELDNNPTEEYLDLFQNNKLMWKRIGSQIRFLYDEEGFYGLDSTCIMVGDNLKLIAGIMNSRLGNYLLQYSPRTGTGDLILSVQALEPFPVPELNSSNEKLVEGIEYLVDQVTNQKKIGQDKRPTQYLEEQIDQLVYKLYAFTDEEIAIVEGSEGK